MLLVYNSLETFLSLALCNGIIFDTFSCSGNIPLYSISLIINVNGFAKTYFAVFTELFKMPSIPLLDLFLNDQSPV